MNETEIKQMIEQIGYTEVYRYSQEKDNLIRLLNQEIERLKEDKKKVLELIQNDYFEDGSFKNYYEVLNILKEGKQ